MNKTQKGALALLRISFGWLFLYAGIVKVFDSSWTAAGFLANASTFPDFYAYLADPQVLVIVDFLNVWGLVLIGLSLMSGVLVRYAAAAGALLMMLYYFPNLEFPYADGSSYIVDSHIIYALVFLFFATYKDVHVWSLERPVQKIFRRR